jgi:hypothetical protein
MVPAKKHLLNKIWQKIDQRIIVVLFFIALLGTGLNIFKDYGVGWDEKHNRCYGIITVDHVLGKNPQAGYYSSPDHRWNPTSGQFAKTHGPVFEVLLAGIEKSLYSTSDRRINVVRHSREIILLRHIATSSIFAIGIIFFYLLCKIIFNSRAIGLLGSLFLVLSPRIFADSFHNSMDISFLAMFIVSMFTLVKFLEKKSIPWALLHAA